MTFSRKSARNFGRSRQNLNKLSRRRSFVKSIECLEARLTMDATYHNLGAGNFTQDWTNAALITTDDIWTGVPSIEGFRGDTLTAATGVDPQTVLMEDTVPVPDVTANNTTPDSFGTGGVAEFAITNPAVGLNGSGTADAPYIQLYLNTTGRNTVVLAFNARDLDASADDAVQQIAVHFRVGNTGAWTNLPTGYIADASTAGSATQVTARSVTLPVAAENQAQVQVRIMTTNAGGNDEWIGIDDIVVSSSGAVGGNQPPVNTAPTGSLPGTEDTPLAITSISVADPDVANTLTTTVSVPNNTFGTFAATSGAGTAVVTFANSNATVQIVGSQANVNAALQTLIFTPAANRAVPPDTAPVVTVLTSDGTASDTDTFSINLNEINDAPVVGADALAAANEDAAPIVIPVATLLLNDSKGAPNESTQTLTISSTFSSVVGGTVQLVGSDVVFTPTPNYSGPASFNYTVTDNGMTGGMPSPLSGSGTASFTINPVNDIPLFTPGPNQTVPFGTTTAQTVNGWATAISAGGGETQTLTFNVTNNSNSSLFTVGGQPAVSPTGVLTFTPVGTAGTATITLVLSDNGGTANGGVDATAPITFTITVTSPGNAPTISTINPVSINEDAGLQTVNFSGVTDGGDPQQQAIVISATSSNPTLIPNPSVTYTSPNATGSLSFTPAANSAGTATITVTVRDSGLDLLAGTPDDLTTTTNFLVTVNSVNDAPTINAFGINPFNAVEDDGAIPFVFNGISAGPNETQTLSVTATSSNQSLALDPVVTYTSPAATATATVNLLPNRSGTTTITVTVRDAGLDGTLNTADDATTSTTEVINVAAVNDKPTITTAGNQTVAFNSGPQVVAGFASVVSFGPPDEAGQAINNYVVNSNSNLGLFSTPPSIAANGTLSYTPATGQQGTATIMISGVDNGGNSNGGQPTSDLVSFTITVNPPSPNAMPTLNAISDLTINEDASLQTINLSGITDGGDATAQAIAVLVSSSNPTLVPIVANYTSPNATGTLTFTPPVDGNGSSIVTVTVRDSGLDLIPGNADDGSTMRTFNVTVNSVNDVPSFVIGGTQTVNEDTLAQSVPGFASSLSAGPADENTQTLTFNVTGNSNPSLFAAAPSISSTGTLTYTPAANAFGSATISVTLSDNGGTANGGVDTTSVQTFTITVNPVNDAPTFAVGPNITVPNTAGPQTIAGQANSIAAGPANEVGQTVSFSVSNNTNPAIFAAQPSVASNGTLTFTPAAGASGTATITLVAQDNGGTANGGVDTSSPQTFTITVLANSPPTISAIGNLVINENAGPQTVNLSGITAGGEAQNLAVTASSNNPALIVTPSVSYSSPASTGVLTFAPTVGQTGTATITVNVRDAGFDGLLNTADDGLASTSFTVQVNPVNDPPVANDQTRAAVVNTPVSGTLTASDPDGPALTYAIVMNPALGTLTFFNPTTGAFTYTPTANVTGLDLFTFSVTDGTSTDTGIVRIAIQGAQPVVTPSGGDLIVIGTPEPDMIIITHVSAGVVRVRTDLATAHYPVTGQLIVNSGEGADYVVATGVIVPTTLDLAEGDDYASSGLQDDLIIGGAGNDQINASGGNNVVWGDTVGEQDLPTGGSDVLSSLNGNDTIYGGGANDQIFSGGGNDYVNAGQGDDTVSSGAGNDRVFGGQGIDSLYGDEGDDVITGGAGSDSLVGRTGNDILIGGLGGDSINGDEGIDLLFGGDTTNSASSTAGDANDLALIAMLASWNAGHPAGLASGLSTGNDGSADNLLGYTGDDDFYVNTNDSVSDFGLPFMGDDRFFTA